MLCLELTYVIQQLTLRDHYIVGVENSSGMRIYDDGEPYEIQRI